MRLIVKAIAILSSFLLMAVLGCKESGLSIPQDTSGVIFNADSTTVQFKGIVTGVKNDCWADGECSIEVNHTWWIEIEYGLRDPSTIPKERGRSGGIRFRESDESIGKRVSVYAGIIDAYKLTLEGNNAYYVYVIETKNQRP